MFNPKGLKMFQPKIDVNEELLQKELTRLIEELKKHDPGSNEYNQISDQIVKLYSIPTPSTYDRVSKDTMVNAGAQLLGIFAILNYERLGVITSKAFSIISRIR